MSTQYESDSNPPSRNPRQVQPDTRHTFTIAEVNTGKTWIFFIDLSDHSLWSFSGEEQGSYVAKKLILGGNPIKVAVPSATATSPLASAVERDGRTVHVFYLKSETRILSEVIFDGTADPLTVTAGKISTLNVTLDTASYLSAIGPKLRVIFLKDQDTARFLQAVYDGSEWKTLLVE